MGAQQSLEEKETVNEYELIKQTLKEARFHFTFKCLDKMKQISPQENVVFSPYGLYDALLLAYFASSGVKEEFLKHILFVANVSKDKLIEFYRLERETYLESKILYSDSADCGINSNCWIRNVNECVKYEKLRGIFPFDIKSLELCENSVLDSVNKTMRDTADKIILDTDITNDSSTELILTTALDFKKGFDMKTKYEKIPLFWTKQNIPNIENRNCKAYECYDLDVSAIEYPINYHRSLFVLVPTYYMRKLKANPLLKYKYADFNIDERLTNMIKNISSEKALGHLRKLLSGEMEHKQSLVDNKYCGMNPIFELEKDLPIKDLLKELVQDTDIMDGLATEDDKNLDLGHAVHRTHIRITPDYTEAGAITAIVDGSEHHDRPEDRDLWEPDRPFVWLIYDKIRQTVFFAGICNKRVEDLRPSKLLFNRSDSYKWEV